MSAPPASDVDEDDLFDRRLPRQLQLKSSVHLTPVAVARRAARLLAPEPGMRVLDIGAGPGKFCVIAALEVPTCSFVGVELRPHLVQLARKLAARLSVTNASFVGGDAFELDWSEYDAFYFYNPFVEQLHDPSLALDRSLTLAPDRYLEYVIRAGKRLASARIGARVVTYHGFGASAPPGYDLIERHPIGTDSLELWIKLRDAGAEGITSWRGQ
jgi:SAM-dependent methyltransferase